MKTLADIKIGRKLTIVLGACVLLLASLSGLSMWNARTMNKSGEIARDRLTKALLADRVARGIGAASIRVRSIASSSNSEQNKSELLEIRKSYLEAIAEFKTKA